MKKKIASVLVSAAFLAIFLAFFFVLEPVFDFLKSSAIDPVIKPFLVKSVIRPFFDIVPDLFAPHYLNMLFKLALFILICWGALKILVKILEYAVKKLSS